MALTFPPKARHSESNSAHTHKREPVLFLPASVNLHLPLISPRRPSTLTHRGSVDRGPVVPATRCRGTSILAFDTIVTPSRTSRVTTLRRVGKDALDGGIKPLIFPHLAKVATGLMHPSPLSKVAGWNEGVVNGQEVEDGKGKHNGEGGDGSGPSPLSTSCESSGIHSLGKQRSRTLRAINPRSRSSTVASLATPPLIRQENAITVMTVSAGASSTRVGNTKSVRTILGDNESFRTASPKHSRIGSIDNSKPGCIDHSRLESIVHLRELGNVSLDQVPVCPSHRRNRSHTISLELGNHTIQEGAATDQEVLLENLPPRRVQDENIFNGKRKAVIRAEDERFCGIGWDALKDALERFANNHDATVLAVLLRDENDLCSLMRDILRSHDSMQLLLRLGSNDAEQFMVFLQSFLDKSSALCQGDEELLHVAQRLIVKLARTSGVLPSSLSIEGINKVTPTAISGGAFADIYRAWHEGKEVALKKFRVFESHTRHNVHRMLCKEALIWKQLRHDNVLPFLGVDADTFPGFICMVSPWMQRGTIMDYVRDMNPSANGLTQLLFQVAKGIEYLHSSKVVHGDLRGGNILIDDQLGVRIADFGLAIFSDASLTAQTLNGKGTMRWMAPELHFPENFGLEGYKPTYAVDVYAFACTSVEIFTLTPPFSHIRSDGGVLKELLRGGRPRRPQATDGQSISDDLWNLLQLCWSEQPSERPSVSAVIDTFGNWPWLPTESI